MLSYALYQDAGADGAELFDQIGADTAYAFQTPGWNHLDPQLEYMDQYQHAGTYNWRKHYYNNTGAFVAYDRSAHGFSLDTQQASADHLYQFGLNTDWHGEPDQYRHLRYVSPTDGASLSSSDSTFSDYAFSPDMARSMHAPTSFPAAEVYPSPTSDYPTGYFSPVYQQPPTAVLQPSTPMLSSPTACSMKEVLYNPEDDINDVAMEESEIKIKVQPPEELELHEEPSPHDSGRGQSVDDTYDGDDDYETPKPETDNDSDFTPSHASRHAQSTTPRTSQRTQRRTTSQPHAVQGETVRVRKPTPAKSKSKSSKPTPIANKHKNSKIREKSFPCPFHPFGCPAVFPSKNEWKRHTASQHLQLGFYRCDLGSCNIEHESGLTASRGYNDFNRKDLFTQHCRRMHRPESWGSKEYNQVSKAERGKFDEFMEEVRGRCWRKRREAPWWLKCGVGGCGKVFKDKSGEGEEGKAWEERMEHVARHYELGDGKEEEGVDEGLREWAVEHGVVSEGGVLVGLMGEGEEGEEVEGVGRGGKRRSTRRAGSGYGLKGSQGEIEDEIEVQVNGADGPTGLVEDEKKVDVKVDEDEDEDTDAEGEEE